MSKDEKNSAVMSGYLEKKGKMKVVSSWKTQWFVLQEGLLLYYRSKYEYDALSPCKGSINLGPNCTVKPCSGTSCVFQIETRANTILLKAKSRLEQEQWLQAILVALHQSSISPTGMAHFRYSSGDLQQNPKEETKQVLLTRQLTMPSRQKLDIKQTNNCGTFEYLKKRNSVDKQKTQSADIRSSLSKEKTAQQRTSEIINNDLYCQNSNTRSCLVNAKPTQQRTSELINNDLYSLPKEPELNFPRKADIRSKGIEHLYDRISADDEIIPDVATNVKQVETFIHFRDNKPENLYERISSSSNESGKLDVDKTVILENDQYCTPHVEINETKHVHYHEYNIPQLDNDLYSIPNIDQNDNKLSSTYQQVNPYSICHIYPKKQDTIDEVLYDDPITCVETKEDKNIMTKAKRLSSSNVEEKPSLPKKKSFLRNFFKLRLRKKSTDSDTDKSGDIFLNKVVLEELQQLLEAKRRNLEMIMNASEQSTSFMNMEEAIYQEISEMIPHLQKQKNERKSKTGASCKIEPKTLKTIDDILNDLDDMKRNKKDVTCSRVQELIDKFDNTSIANMNKLIDDDEVTIREKNENIVDNTLYDIVDSRVSNSRYTSSDELNKLLSELVKVTNAPLMEPGVTTSLGVTNCLDTEFRSLEKLKLRRHSDPDYDIPRPHSNLNIAREELKKDDALVATRFFGPVLTGNEGISQFSTPMASMAPDSLEMQNSSYNSHCYANAKIIRRYINQKNFKMEDSNQDDVFVDSLEPFNFG